MPAKTAGLFNNGQPSPEVAAERPLNAPLAESIVFVTRSEMAHASRFRILLMGES
jgi:hypothetical protein